MKVKRGRPSIPLSEEKRNVLLSYMGKTYRTISEMAKFVGISRHQYEWVVSRGKNCSKKTYEAFNKAVEKIERQQFSENVV